LIVPIQPSFLDRLVARLSALAACCPTPFHVYDAAGIAASHRTLTQAFSAEGFRNYFAVKALPNPAVLRLLLEEGSGLDCSSLAELELAHRVGARGDDIVFTSNNTSHAEYGRALELSALVTLDDRSMLQRFERLPNVVSFRVAPAPASHDVLMSGGRSGSKFGVPIDQAEEAYREALARGATRFGIHSMSLANTLDAEGFADAHMALVRLAARLANALGIHFEYINLGGGPGIPYRPGERAFDMRRYAGLVEAQVAQSFGALQRPRLVMECGRCVSGPHGVLVASVVSVCDKGRRVVGVDASMSALMRPGMYPAAYHHISSPLVQDRAMQTVDVVGSLCENNDFFGRDRELPAPREGDILLIHDTGAHGHAMGFNYNGRLRPAELLMRGDGVIEEIRRAESFDDYVGTVRWTPLQIDVEMTA
jgi:diaminopimelate decarboxylase